VLGFVLCGTRAALPTKLPKAAEDSFCSVKATWVPLTAWVCAGAADSPLTPQLRSLAAQHQRRTSSMRFEDAMLRELDAVGWEEGWCGVCGAALVRGVEVVCVARRGVVGMGRLQCCVCGLGGGLQR
jgi:hypothetical protein